MENKEKSKYYALRVHEEEFKEFEKMSKATFYPMCRLVKMAIPLLKKKLRIKDEVGNGGSEL